MKRFLLALTFCLVLLLPGCQEYYITDPNQDVSLQKTDVPSINSGLILLEGLLEIPNQPNTFLKISGQVKYVHELFYVDPIPPAPQYYVSLILNTNADLTDPSIPKSPVWYISNNSEDIFYVSEEGIYLLDKIYTIEGREDGLLFYCRFLVTTDGIGLNEMALVLPDGDFN